MTNIDSLKRFLEKRDWDGLHAHLEKAGFSIELDEFAKQNLSTIMDDYPEGGCGFLRDLAYEFCNLGDCRTCPYQVVRDAYSRHGRPWIGSEMCSEGPKQWLLSEDNEYADGVKVCDCLLPHFFEEGGDCDV